MRPREDSRIARCENADAPRVGSSRRHRSSSSRTTSGYVSSNFIQRSPFDQQGHAQRRSPRCS
eukprot:2981553-Prymnesium_polylepis.1